MTNAVNAILVTVFNILGNQTSLMLEAESETTEKTMSIDKSLLEKLEKLPAEKRREVEEFVEALLNKQKPKTKAKLRQDWAGALRDCRDQYTSLELQKKALEWRGD